MSVAAAMSHFATSSTSFVDIFARGLKPKTSPAEIQPAQSWVEICPYGFVSRSYINYMAGRLNDCSVSRLNDGSTVVNFANGTMIVQSTSGHVVELDKHRRVVLVRVTRSEAKGAQLTLGREELSECFESTTNERGQFVVVMPGNIVIVEEQQQVTISFPSGTKFFARRMAA